MRLVKKFGSKDFCFLVTCITELRAERLQIVIIFALIAPFGISLAVYNPAKEVSRISASTGIALDKKCNSEPEEILNE